ncbi:hypothetical protein ACFYUV_51065 [Nonomuraea sp. NPDC003560]|uniref:hypothetical protein n=1 Tax=Nonomuraea sp. NPDC003560 TaxID=3364341 RepID=UPI0036BB7185
MATSRVPGWEDTLGPFHDLLRTPGGEQAARSIRAQVGKGLRLDMLGKAKVIAAENVACYLTGTYTRPEDLYAMLSTVIVVPPHEFTFVEVQGIDNWMGYPLLRLGGVPPAPDRRRRLVDGGRRRPLPPGK